MEEGWSSFKKSSFTELKRHSLPDFSGHHGDMADALVPCPQIHRSHRSELQFLVIYRNIHVKSTVIFVISIPKSWVSIVVSCSL